MPVYQQSLGMVLTMVNVVLFVIGILVLLRRGSKNQEIHKAKGHVFLSRIHRLPLLFWF